MSERGKMWRHNWQVNPLVESRFKPPLKPSNSDKPAASYICNCMFDVRVFPMSYRFIRNTVLHPRR
jgi:hypothetical protein